MLNHIQTTIDRADMTTALDHQRRTTEAHATVLDNALRRADLEEADKHHHENNEDHLRDLVRGEAKHNHHHEYPTDTRPQRRATREMDPRRMTTQT